MTDLSLFRSGSRHGYSFWASLCVLQCDCCMDVILPLHVIPSRFTVEHLYKFMEHTQMCRRGDVNWCRGQYQFLGEWNKYNRRCLFCQQCHYQCYKTICFIKWRILGVSKNSFHRPYKIIYFFQQYFNNTQHNPENHNPFQISPLWCSMRPFQWVLQTSTLKKINISFFSWKKQLI